LSQASLTSEGRINLEKEKQARTGSLAKKGLFEVARNDDPNQTVVVDRNKILALIPGLKKWLTDQGINPYQGPKILQPDVNPSKMPDDQLKMLLSEYPGFFNEKRTPELYGEQSAVPQSYNTPLLPGYQPVKPYQKGTGPLRTYGQPTQQPAQAPQPAELATSIYNDAQSIYNKGKSADQVKKDLKKLIDDSFPDADPSQKIEIGNELLKRF
jgi:hypothetical protein